jgi:hypothetical protein
LKSLALPREAHQLGNINGLAQGLGGNTLNELQRVSAARPKPEFLIFIAEWGRNSREVMRVALDYYNGPHTTNARLDDDDDVLKPGKTGITLALKHRAALADAIPGYVDCVTIIADPDPDGRRFASELKAQLGRRRIGHCILVWDDGDRATP